MSPACYRSQSLLAAALASLLSVGLPGCGAQSDAPRIRSVAVVEAAPPQASQTVFPRPDLLGGTDYDPWESFNEKTFFFNYNVLDHYALKPAATVWSAALPNQVRQCLTNAFDNVAMPRRFVNKVLQGRFRAAGQELARFLVNTTAGIAGFFDVATRAGLNETDADTGQTLGVYGVKPGPYLVLPLLPPLTVRDAIGYAADSFMDPLSYFVTPIAADFGRAAGKTLNDRAANLEIYQDVEDTSLDLYAAVRNGYLQRRQESIDEAIRDRDQVFDRRFHLAPRRF